MHLSSTIMEIWHLKHNWVTTLTFSGSCDVISHVTIRLAVGDFLCVVHCDHASILHRYGDVVPQKLGGCTHGCTDGCSGDFILCPMLYIALDRQQVN